MASRGQQIQRNRYNRHRLNLESLEERLVPTTFTFLEATGANAAAIQSTVDSFRSNLGTLNANTAGSVGSGRREINWDGVPNALAAPNALPADFFNTSSPRGVVLSTPGSGFEVSANAGIGPVRFDDINGQYSNIFSTFSAQRLFTPLDSNVTDITFFVPGSTTPASVNGFGAVFSDVDNSFSTKIEFFSNNNVLLFSRTVLPTPGNSSLSFLGAIADTGTPIFKVRITAGALPLGDADVTQGGTEKVVMDDFIYGEPLVPVKGGNVSGLVFSDVNGDGVKQASEPGLGGITVFEDANANGIFDNAEKNTQTAANGSWTLTFVADAVRRIRHERPFGSTQTTTNTNVNIFGGSADTLNFGDQLNTPVSNVTVNAPNAVNENGQVTISGTFQDADSQPHTVTIDFGDGSTPGVINLGAGVTSYSTTHIYLDDAPSGTSSDVKTITATVSDGVSTDIDTRTITVNNVAPSNASVTATPTTAGNASTITVTFTDPGTLDPHLIDIDFGDGSPVQSFGVAPGQNTFNKAHVYANQGTFTITATVHDDDLGTAPAAQTTLVVNAPDTTPPTVASGSISNISVSESSVGTNLVVTVNFNEAMNTSLIPALTFSPTATSTFTLVSSQWIDSDTHVFTYSIADANVEQTAFATVSLAQDIAGNVMVPDTLGVGITIDTRAPIATSIDDGDADNLIPVGSTLIYTITFNESMQGSSLSTGDFDNAGTAAISIGTITQTSSTTFTIQVTPSTPGTLQLRIPNGATIADLRGNALVPAVLDGDVLTVGSPLPVVIPAPSQTGSEGTPNLFAFGSISDFNNSGNYTVTVNWGDGTPDTVFNQVTAGTITPQPHTFPQDGNFTVITTVQDADGTSSPATFVAKVTNVLPNRTPPATQSAFTGINQAFNLGSFADPGADAPWTININWGDGTPNTTIQLSTPGVIPPQNHTYTNAGNFTLGVTVVDDDDSFFSSSTVIVANSVPVATPPANQNSNEGSAKAFLLGSFSDANNSSNYTVTVNWGDGTPNTIFQQANAGVITQKSHAYVQDGNFNVSVTVADADGFSTPATFVAQIGNVLPVAVDAPNQNAVATVAKSFALGSFSDPGDDAPWQISVNWGDGTPNVNFSVNQPGTLPPLTHTFSNPGTFNVVVTVRDDDSSATSDYLVTVIPPISHIQGSVFRDFNGNGLQGSNDTGLAGVVVFADRNGNNLLDTNEPTATTNSAGNYLLDVGFEGPVFVREVVPAGFRQTTANLPSVNVSFNGTFQVGSMGNARILTPTIALSGRVGNLPTISALNGNGSTRFTLTPYTTIGLKDVRVATGDVNDDGVEDIIAAQGAGGNALVKVFDGTNGTLLRSILAFDSRLKTGFTVASGDVNGDGFAEVIVGTEKGTTPVVNIYDGKDNVFLRQLVPAYSLSEGVRITVGDVNGDGMLDIVTTSGPSTSATRIKVFDANTGATLQAFHTATVNRFSINDLQVTAGDLDGDGKAEIITTFSDLPVMQVYNQGNLVQNSIATKVNQAKQVVKVLAKDVNGDGIVDFIFASGPGQLPRLRIVNGSTGLDLFNALVLDGKTKNGLFAG